MLTLKLAIACSLLPWSGWSRWLGACGSFSLMSSPHGALFASVAMGGSWLWRISGGLAAYAQGTMGWSP
jgi:hypothetical protein